MIIKPAFPCYCFLKFFRFKYFFNILEDVWVCNLAVSQMHRLGNMTTNETGDLRSAGVVQVLDVSLNVGCNTKGLKSFSTNY